MNTKRSARAFTLLELMVAVAVCGFAVSGTVVLLRQVLDIYYYDTGRLLLNRDVRRLAQGLESMGTTASFAWVYPTYGQWASHAGFATFNGGAESTGDTSTNTNVAPNQGGSVIVFFFEATDPSSGAASITRVAGYFIDAAQGNQGPLRAFDITLPSPEAVDAPSAPNPIYGWLPSILGDDARQAAATLIPTAAPMSDAGLFVNLGGRSVMVQALFTESGDLSRSTTSAPFQFTVTPRG